MKRFVVGSTLGGERHEFKTIDEVEWFFECELMESDPEGVINGEYYIDDMIEEE